MNLNSVVAKYSVMPVKAPVSNPKFGSYKLFCHACEGRHPVFKLFSWNPIKKLELTQLKPLDASLRWHDRTNSTAVFRMNLVWALVLLIAAPLLADPLLPTKIEVFSNRTFPVKEDLVPAQPIEIIYYKLDVPNELKWEIDSDDGEEILAVQYETDAQGEPIQFSAEELLKRSKVARTGKDLVEQYGLRWLPAIVFDGGKSAIYGVTDLKEALDKYRLWKSQEPKS